MSKNNNALSVIIPSRNSPFLVKTIEDVLAKAEGEIEVIVNIDENPPKSEVKDSRVTYMYPKNRPIGLRKAINACAAKAKGKYIMKTDDHCMFAPGFDRALVENTQDNWIVVPSRYSLDAEKWAIEKNRKPRRDYHYLCYPDPHKGHDGGMHGVEWWDRGKERSDPKYDIDDNPSFQGSCWFMAKDYFDNFLHGMQEEGYGQFAQETQEITLKTWLGGGAVKVNKKTWYAHLRKGRRYGRMYEMPPGNVEACNWSARHWVNNEEPGMIHKFEWLVNEKFPNMPTWPADWQQRLTDEGVIKNNMAKAEFSSDTYFSLVAKSALDFIESDEYQQVLDILFDCYRRGGTVFTMGCGGSASTATHFAADLAKTTMVDDNPGFKAISLVDNIPLVSAWVNDKGWGSIFAGQLGPWLTRNDVVVGFSVHGGTNKGDEAGPWSQNLVAAMKLARKRRAKIIGFSGFDGGAMKEMADAAVIIPINSEPHGTPVIEAMHVVLHHSIIYDLKKRIKEY